MPSLELGPGEYVQHPDWVVMDIEQHPGVNLIGDAAKIPFEDNHFDRIEAKNILEHFSFNETVNVLKEWNRVLKPDGAILIVVPLIGAAIKRYLEIDHLCSNLQWGLMGGQRNKYDFHYTLFDEPYLKECLAKAGFVNTEVKSYYKDDFGNTCGIEVEAKK